MRFYEGPKLDLKASRAWRPFGDGLFRWGKFGDNGPPILFTNPHIRKMLKLAGAGRNDRIYELGSGWGQNLIIAAEEFGVKLCVGIEKIHPRFETAQRRISSRALSKQIRLFKGYYQDLLEGRVPDADISEATIILFGLEDKELIDDLLSIQLNQNCRLVYYNLTLFPEIMPSSVDYPFYVSNVPFDRPTSERGWLTAILQKDSFDRTKTVEELWNELYHDYNVERQGIGTVLDYRRRLRAVLRNSGVN